MSDTKPCNHCDNNAKIGITYFDYWQQVRQIATTAKVRELLDQGDVQDYLHETIDGHAYIIYTFKAMAVLMHTCNDDAAWDDQGQHWLHEASSMSDLYTRAAYWAMLADVRDCEPDDDVEITLSYDCPGVRTAKYVTMTLGELRENIDELRENYENLHIAD